MARPLRIEYAGAFYHVTAPGDTKVSHYKSLSRTQRRLKKEEGLNREVKELESRLIPDVLQANLTK